MLGSPDRVNCASIKIIEITPLEVFLCEIDRFWKWRACFQNLLHPPGHVTHFYHLLYFAIKNIMWFYLSCGLLSFDVLYSNVFKEITTRKDWQVEVDRRGLEPNSRLIYSFVFLDVCVYFMTGLENSFNYWNIRICWYCVLQISRVSTCSICSEFCAENGYFALTWAANK